MSTRLTCLVCTFMWLVCVEDVLDVEYVNKCLTNCLQEKQGDGNITGSITQVHIHHRHPTYFHESACVAD